MAATSRLIDKTVAPSSTRPFCLISAGQIAKKLIPSVMLAGGPGRGKSIAELIISALEIDDYALLRLKGAKDNSAETIPESRSSVNLAAGSRINYCNNYSRCCYAVV